MDEKLLEALGPFPDVVKEHMEFHADKPFQAILVTVNEDGCWYATDTGEGRLSDHQIACALTNVVESLIEEAEKPPLVN